MTKEITHACPECGANGHIYGNADIYLDGDAWRILAIEEKLECTECDAIFWQSEVAGIPDPSSLCEAPGANAEAGALELLKRGLECGIFDDAPTYAEDVRAILARNERGN